MKKALALVLVLLFAGSLFAQQTIWFDGDFEQAKAKAKAENKLLLIDFYSDG